jgi:predicted DCC family thiol-disulfide oxidoreductase YuxK
MAHFQKRDTAGRVEWVNIAAPQFAAEAYGLDPARVQQVMHARGPDGTIYTEVRAFVQIWKAIPTFFTTLLRGLLKIPGMLFLAGIAYRLFARNRHRLTGRCTPESCTIDAAPVPSKGPP